MMTAAKRSKKTESTNEDNDGPIVAHISPEEKQRVRDASKAMDRSISWWVRKAIAEKLERDDGK